MRAELGPVLSATLAVLGPLPLKPLLAQALHMGDEVHNRNVAATGQFLKKLAPALLSTDRSMNEMQRTVQFVTGNDHFFSHVSMAACKAMLEEAAGIAGSVRRHDHGPQWRELRDPDERDRRALVSKHRRNP